MVVIIRFRVRPDEFDLGRILRVEEGMSIDLETYIPSGTRSSLFFSMTSEPGTDLGPTIERIRNHPSVRDLEIIEIFEERTLLAINWNIKSDCLFQGVQASNGQILNATGTSDEWELAIRFRAHDGLAKFREYCEAHSVGFTLLHIYQLHEPKKKREANDPGFGLTARQYEALILAVERGYFAIPRQCSTADLARELGISAQSVTERLRRGVANIVRHVFIDDEYNELDDVLYRSLSQRSLGDVDDADAVA
jgi:predicted DNA binding protein